MTAKVDEMGSDPSCNTEIDRVLHPGRFYDRPADVLVDASLTMSERRAILSAWASDACAVESAPPLRHAPFALRPVTFDEVMDALVELDRRQALAGNACQTGRGSNRRTGGASSPTTLI
jgi:hypothetical protein